MISDNDFRQGEDQPELVAWAQQEPPVPASLPTEEIAGLLESLVSKSLVRLTERSEPPRFMLLETIREYALERLAESGEEQATRWRHAGYYTWWHDTINSWTHLRGIAAVEDELENFRALLSWCIESGEVLPGLIIGADFTLWGERANEGRQWLAALLSQPVPLSHAAAYAWYSAAFLAISTYDYPAARAALDTSFQMHAQFGEPTYLKYFGLGFIALGEGDVAGAGRLFEQFLVHADEPTNPNRDDTVAWAHVGLGAYDLMAGSLAEAQTHLEASLTFFRATSQIEPVASTLNRLGFIAQLQGDLRCSASYFRESIELGQTRHYRRNISTSLFSLAGVALGQGKLEQAAQLLDAAETLREMTGGRDPDERYLV